MMVGMLARKRETREDSGQGERAENQRRCRAVRGDPVTNKLAASLFDLDDFATFIVAALRAGTMRQLALVAIGALGQRLGRQMIVGTTLGCARLRMTPFRIRHDNLTNRTARTGPAIGT
jgi:hypothetical protein